MNLIYILLLTLLIDPSKISEVNKAKERAKESYARGDYKEAARQYRMLVDSLGVSEEEVAMNMGHSYYQIKDTLNAKNTYFSLTSSANPQYRSVSYQQLGMLAYQEGKLEEALAHFKSALKANPANEDARYNYELVKKKLEEQQQQQRNDQDKKDQEQKENKDQEKKDQKQNEQQQKDQQKKEQEEKQKQEQQKKDQEKKEQEEKQKKEQEQKDEKKDDKKEPQPSSDKMKMMKISEEKAKMVLEAMKNQEIQYLQQNKRKATKPKDKGKPDW